MGAGLHIDGGTLGDDGTAGDGKFLHTGEDAAGTQIPLLGGSGVGQQIFGDGFIGANVGGLDPVIVVDHQNAVDGPEGFHSGGDIGAQHQLGLIAGGLLHHEELLQLTHTGIRHLLGDLALQGQGQGGREW